MFGAALVAVSFVSCSPQEQSGPTARDDVAQDSQLAPAGMFGRWRILAIDGKPPVGRADRERTPYIGFFENTAGGTVGCNSFGGLGLLADGRYAIHSWSGTAIGCPGALGDQEQAVSELFRARPAVTVRGDNRLFIKSEEHSLELERSGPNQGPPVPAGSNELTGTNWQVVMMDVSEAADDPKNRYLRFLADQWQATVSCATLNGSWKREGNRLIVGDQIGTTEQNCPPRFARIDDAFAEMMQADPRFLVGPNGELLIAGGGHALTGDRSN